MPVWPGVPLCVLAPHPACTRYKVRHARLVGGGSGTKCALLGQNLPNWAFLGEQASFIPGVEPCDSCRASFVSPWHLPCSLLPGFRRPRALRTGPAGFGMASMLVIEGVLQH